MFLKRGRPETDDFSIKKLSGCEGKIFQYFKKCDIFYKCDTLTKIFLKCLHIFAFKNIFIFSLQKLAIS